MFEGSRDVFARFTYSFLVSPKISHFFLQWVAALIQIHGPHGGPPTRRASSCKERMSLIAVINPILGHSKQLCSIRCSLDEPSLFCHALNIDNLEIENCVCVCGWVCVYAKGGPSTWLGAWRAAQIVSFTAIFDFIELPLGDRKDQSN